ncbi:flagellar biosynthetic protein FliO [Psychrobacillus sp. NPDC058041]|uniref:flagellar biosynthetic protein FliO n=1 Tax=Psychrobacillus sp. NPDC058041 TaxID=3346310 RepID=UPI0036D8963A
MMRKFTLVYCIICILLLIPYQLEVQAETDSNDTIYDTFEKKNNGTVKDPTTVVDPDTSKSGDIPSSGISITVWDYVKMIFALLFVILLLYGLLRFVNSRNKSFQQNQLIQNLGGVGLGQGKSVQLLQAGNALLLVGIGEDITLIKEITDPEEIAKLTKIYEDKQDIGKTVPYISELFSQFKGNLTLKKNSNENKDPTFNETFQKRLQEIQKDRSDVLKDWKTKEREENE